MNKEVMLITLVCETEGATLTYKAVMVPQHAQQASLSMLRTETCYYSI